MLDAASLPADAASQPYVWLTAAGRRTGQPRTVELWFALRGATLYFLAGGGPNANWVRNSFAAGTVRARLASATYRGTPRAVEPGTDEDELARRLLAAKYQGWSEGKPLSRWAQTSFAVAVELGQPVDEEPAAPDSATS
jgi:deazaflavin-dependent oxidoreductase (nitroreductase family)